MSHPPETSLSSRELAEQILVHETSYTQKPSGRYDWKCKCGSSAEDFISWNECHNFTTNHWAAEITALIDAYVQMKVEAVWGHVFQGLDEPCNCENHCKLTAWVRVREGEARRNEASIWNSIRITAVNLPGQSQIEARNRIIELESALATARKQLEEKAP